MKADVDKVFEAVDACRRHGHQPERLHITRRFLDALLLADVGPSPSATAVGDDWKEAGKKLGERRAAFLKGEGTLVGYPVTVHDTQPDIWIHDDEWGRT